MPEGTGGVAPVAPSAGGGGSGSGEAGGPATPLPSGACSFDVSQAVSDQIATVGIVTWSTDLADVTSATIDFGLDDGPKMQAPVDLEDKSGDAYRTLLLGMKQAHDYTFTITANSGTSTCTSDPYTITTGTLPNAPTISRDAANADAAIGGFIVTSAGLSVGGGFGGGGGGMMGGGNGVFIIDADGDVVWYMDGPASTSRAHMSYDGKQMWMLSLNVQNGGGEMRWASMDGSDVHMNVEGLSTAHHDFCIRPDNGISTMLWDGAGLDPPSFLVEWHQDGTIDTVVRIDSAIYQSGTYHSNAIHYYPEDDSYTISDRNPNLFVKLNRQGQVLWQFGGSCTNAPAPKCASGNWQVNHGHQLLRDGRFVFFNNGMGGSTVYEYQLTETANALEAQELSSHSDSDSMVLGDVQGLPNGGLLITYSNSGVIDELDASGNRVQRLTAPSFGYSDWRPTLYGPPERY